VLRKRKEILGDDHPHTLTSMADLAVTYKQIVGRLNEACELEEQVLRKRKEILGDDHPDTLLSMEHLAWTYKHVERRMKEAWELEDELLKKRKERKEDGIPLSSMLDDRLSLERESKVEHRTEERQGLFE